MVQIQFHFGIFEFLSRGGDRTDDCVVGGIRCWSCGEHIVYILRTILPFDVHLTISGLHVSQRSLPELVGYRCDQ